MRVFSTFLVVLLSIWSNHGVGSVYAFDKEATRSAYSTIQAEEYYHMGGLSEMKDGKGNTVIGHTTVGGWSQYHSLDFGTTGSTEMIITYSAPKDFAGKTLTIRKDNKDTGPILARVTLAATSNKAPYAKSDWDIYTDLKVTLPKTTGINDIYFVFEGDNAANFDKFTFVSSSSTQSTPSTANTDTKGVTVVVKDSLSTVSSEGSTKTLQGYTVTSQSVGDASSSTTKDTSSALTTSNINTIIDNSIPVVTTALTPELAAYQNYTVLLKKILDLQTQVMSLSLQLQTLLGTPSPFVVNATNQTTNTNNNTTTASSNTTNPTQTNPNSTNTTTNNTTTNNTTAGVNTKDVTIPLTAPTKTNGTISTSNTSTTSSNPGNMCSRFHPGNYIFVNDDPGRHEVGPNGVDGLSTIDSILSKDTTNLKGIVLKQNWGAIETSPGQYNFSELDSALAKLKAKGMYLAVDPIERSFHYTCDRNPVPSFYARENSQGSAIGTKCIAKIWEADTMTAYINLLKAIADHFRNEPNFIGFRLNEVKFESPTITWRQWPDMMQPQWVRLYREIGAYAPDMFLGVSINWTNVSEANPLLDALTSNSRAAAIVWPDTVTANTYRGGDGQAVYDANQNNDGWYQRARERKNSMIIAPAVESFIDRSLETHDEIYRFLRDDIGAHMIIWSDWRDYGDYVGDVIIPTVNKYNGQLNSACPYVGSSSSTSTTTKSNAEIAPTTSTITNAEIAFSPSSWVLCASENGVCDFTGETTIRFGVSGNYHTKVFPSGPVSCTVAVFGDPAVGSPKQCEAIGGNHLPVETVAPTVVKIDPQIPATSRADPVGCYQTDTVFAPLRNPLSQGEQTAMLYTSGDGLGGIHSLNARIQEGRVTDSQMRSFDWIQMGDIGQSYSRDTEYCLAATIKAKYGNKVFSVARPDLFRWSDGAIEAETKSPFTGWKDLDRQAIINGQSISYNKRDWQSDYKKLRDIGYTEPSGYRAFIDFFGSETLIKHPYEVGITSKSNWYTAFLEMNMCDPKWQDVWVDYMAAQLNQRKHLDGITVIVPKVQWYDHMASLPTGKLPDGSPAGSFIAILNQWLQSSQYNPDTNTPNFPSGSIWDFPGGCDGLLGVMEASSTIAAKLASKTDKTVMWMPFNLTVNTWTNPSYRQLLIQDIQRQKGLTPEQATEYMFQFIKKGSDQVDMIWLNPFDPTYDKSLEWYNSLSNGNRIIHRYPQ